MTNSNIQQPTQHQISTCRDAEPVLARIDASNNQRLGSPQKLVSPCTLALLARMTNEILYQQFQVRLTPVQTLSKYYSVT